MTRMRYGSLFFGLFFLITFCFLQSTHGAKDDQPEPGESPSSEKPSQSILKKAVMCGGLKELEPFNEAVVFSVALGKVVCFTAFDPVLDKTVVFHNWYHRDQMEKTFKLTLKPPKWSSFTQIIVRNMDVGPWRVEVLDAEGKRLRILRFSVTE